MGCVIQRSDNGQKPTHRQTYQTDPEDFDGSCYYSKEQSLVSVEGVVNMPSANASPRTLYDKVFRDHIVDERSDGTTLLYIGERTPKVSYPDD